jgi:hypothetical protein
MQLANTNKISFDKVASKFETEIALKKEYEKFVKDFIEIHYK